MKISGITQKNDFAQLLQYLQRLTPVAAVAVDQIQGNDVLLNVSLRGSKQAFLQALSVVGHKLTPSKMGLNDVNLVYQWNN